MKSRLYIFTTVLLGLSITSCEEASKEDKNVEDLPVETTEVESEEESTESEATMGLEEAPVDYFSVCENLELWKGGIQGVESSDSTGPYIMGQCFANEHFDIIVFSKKSVELSSAIVNHNELSKTIPGARYYAFEIPKIEKENPEDEFDLYDYVYPSEVKVYKMIEGKWYLIKKEEITTFEELGQLKLNSIYL